MGIFTDEYGEPVVWRVVLAGIVAMAIAVTIAVIAFGPKSDEVLEDQIEENIAVVPPNAQEYERRKRQAAKLATVEGSELLSDLTEKEKSEVMDAVETFSGDGARVSIPAAPVREGDALLTYLRVEEEGKTTYVTCRHEGDAPVEIYELEEIVEGVNDQDETPIPISDTKALARIMSKDVATEVTRQFLASGIDSADKAWTTAKGTSSEGDVTKFQIHIPSANGSEPVILDAAYDKPFGMLELYPVTAEAREVR